MPKVYLCPSDEQSGSCIFHGGEGRCMEFIAINMEPYLRASGISFTRSGRGMNTELAILQANESANDFYLSLQSNTSPPKWAGPSRGIFFYYELNCTLPQRAANIFTGYFRDIYPQANLVQAVPLKGIWEGAQACSPSVLAKIGFQDNEEDARWVAANIESIAVMLSKGLTDYFGLPFVWPNAPQQGVVAIQSGMLNIRSRPNTNASIIATAQRGDSVTVYGRVGNWYALQHGPHMGFAYASYIHIQ